MSARPKIRIILICLGMVLLFLVLISTARVDGRMRLRLVLYRDGQQLAIGEIQSVKYFNFENASEATHYFREALVGHGENKVAMRISFVEEGTYCISVPWGGTHSLFGLYRTRWQPHSCLIEIKPWTGRDLMVVCPIADRVSDQTLCLSI